MRERLGGLGVCIATVLVALGLVGSLAGCSGGDSGPEVRRIGKPVEIGAAKTGALSASSQRTDGTFVVVDEVVLPRAGYVVVYADGNGAPGRELGVSKLLAKGTSTNVKVKVSPRLTSKVTVHTMLHAEDNKNHSFDFPGHDAPVAVKGSVVETPITIEVTRS
ncbi:MAG: hypothetical protein J7518_06425 [Nocardioidaceae bacterium]|nr:hypothetical protein [Nocardioidaceae bacterium]